MDRSASSKLDPDGILEKVDEFTTSLETFIGNKSSDKALARVFDSENEDLVKMASLDILNMIGPKLRNQNGETGDLDEWHNLQSMLEYVVKLSSPKEMLVGLLELLELAESDEFFQSIVRPLRVTFLRLPGQRGDTLLWAMNSLHDYVSKIPLPSYISELEGDEKAILENSIELERSESCVSSVLSFCEPFVSEAKECKLIASAERRREQIVSIASFLLKLIERPVAYFEWDRQITSELSAKVNGTKDCGPLKNIKMNQFRLECAQRLVRMLFDLNEDFLFTAIDWYERDRLTLVCRFTDDDDARVKETKRVHSTAIGALAFLIYCQGLCLERPPQVYSAEYIFERLLPFAIDLLRSQDASLIELGIDYLGINSQRLFLQSMFTLGIDSFWESERIKSKSYQNLFLSLIAIMNYSKTNRIRQLALGIFTRYLDYFEADGQLSVIRLVYYVYDQSEKADDDNDDDGEGEVETKTEWYFANKGIRGYLIDQYRGKLNTELRRSNFQSPFFRQLPQMLALFTSLKHREATDFLDNFEQYMAALNLARFVCMIRQNGRYSGLSTAVFDRLSSQFVEPMRKGLELSKAHYELDLKNYASDQTAARQSIAFDDLFGKSHDNDQKRDAYEKLRSDQQKGDVLKTALSSFELMISLVARVGELLENCLQTK